MNRKFKRTAFDPKFFNGSVHNNNDIDNHLMMRWLWWS